jgi:cytochrome b561
MEWKSNYQYSSNAPCAMCHQCAPNAQTKVSLSYRINATYRNVVEYSVPVCEECKKLYEAHYIFGFKRMMLEAKVRKWLRTYQVRSKESQVQANRRRSRTLAFYGWIIALPSFLMVLGTFGAYFFPTSDDMQKSHHMTLAGFIFGIIIFGLLLFSGIRLIRKSIVLRRLTRHSS